MYWRLPLKSAKPAAMLDVRLAFGAGRRQIERAHFGQKTGQVRRYGRAPAATLLGLGEVLTRAPLLLDRLDRRREGDIAGSHGGLRKDSGAFM
jgi:hypothetical protein